jgi:hypothetical protein
MAALGAGPSGASSGAMSALVAQLASLENASEQIVAIADGALALGDKALWESFADAWVGALRDRPEKCVEYLYVCNDIVQKCPGRGALELRAQMQRVLPQAMSAMVDESKRPRVLRVLGLWEERNVYTAAFCKRLKKKLAMQLAGASGRGATFAAEEANERGDGARFFLADDEAAEGSDADDEADEEALPGAGSQGDDDAPAPTLLRRTSSAQSLSDVPLPRVLTVCKAMGARALGDALAVEGVLDGAGSIAELLQAMRAARAAEQELRNSVVMEVALLDKLEQHLEAVAARIDGVGERERLTEQVKQRLAALRDKHPGSEAIATTLRTERQVRKRAPGTKRRAHRSDDSESDSDEDNSANHGGAGVFRMQKTERKKKKKIEPKPEAEKPMQYNPVLKKYVPVMQSNQDENWRD